MLNIGGREYARVRFGKERKWADLMVEDGDHFGDCGVAVGSLHHLYCDQEERSKW